MDQLIENLQRIGELSEQNLCWLKKNITRKSVRKGTLLLRAGETQNEIWFNTSGLFKYYYIDREGNEKIKHFCEENRFIFSISALLENKSSRFFIEALEDADLLVLPSAAVAQTICGDGLWHDVFHHYLMESILQKEEREADFLLLDGPNRYRKFLKNYPGLNKRLKQYEVAAYLGMNPAHLSRIKEK